MDNSTEELTPILVPFEKAATYNQFKDQNLDTEMYTLYNMTRDPNQNAQTKGYAQRMIDERRALDNQLGGRFKGYYDKAEHDSFQGHWKQNLKNAQNQVGYIQNGIPTATPPARIPMSEHPSYSSPPSTDYGKTYEHNVSSNPSNSPGNTNAAPSDPSNPPNNTGGQTQPKKNGAVQTTSPATPKKGRGPSKDDVKNGMGIGLNAAGMVVSGLNTMGEASRKLMQGVLNPGVMGQNAANAVAGAGETIVTPTKQRQAAWSGMQDAVNTAADARRLNNERVRNEQMAQLRNNMDSQLRTELNAQLAANNLPDMDAMLAGKDRTGADINQQAAQAFHSTFVPFYQKKIQEWRDMGIDPKLIKEVTDQYQNMLDKSVDRYEENEITNLKNTDKVQTTENEALKAQNEAVQTNNAWTSALGHKGAIENVFSNIHPDLLQALETATGSQQYGRVDPNTGAAENISQAYNDFIVDGNGQHPFDMNSAGQGLFDPSTAQIDLNALDEGTLKKLEQINPDAYTAVMALKTQGSYPHADRATEAKNIGTAAHINETAPSISYGFDPEFLKNTRIDQATADNLQQTCLKEAWGAYGANLASQFTPEEINAFLKNKGLMSLEASDAKIVDALLSKHREHLGKGGLAQLKAAQKKLGSKKRLTADELRVLQLDDTMNAMAAKSKVFADMNRAMEGGNFSFGDTAGDPTKFGAKGKSFVDDVMGRERATAMGKYRESLRLINEEMIRHQSELAKYSTDPSKRLPKGLRDYLYDAMRTEQTDSNLADAKNGTYNLGGAIGSKVSVNKRYNKALAPANEARKLLYLSDLGDLEMDNGDISANNFSQTENVILTMGQSLNDTLDDIRAGNTVPGSVINITTLPKLGVGVDFMRKYGFGTLTQDMLDDPKVMNEITTNLTTLENELNRIASSPDADSHAKTLKEGRGYLAAFRTNMAASLSGRMADKINEEELDAMQAGGASPIPWASNPGTNLTKTLQTLVDRWYARRTGGVNDPSYTKNTALQEVRYMLSRPMEFARIGFQLSGDRNSNIFGNSAKYRANIIGDRNQDYMGRNAFNKNGGLARMNSKTKNRSKDMLYVMFANMLYTS